MCKMDIYSDKLEFSSWHWHCMEFLRTVAINTSNIKAPIVGFLHSKLKIIHDYMKAQSLFKLLFTCKHLIILECLSEAWHEGGIVERDCVLYVASMFEII